MPTKTAQVFDLEGKPTGTTNLPSIFETPLRPDVITCSLIYLITPDPTLRQRPHGWKRDLPQDHVNRYGNRQGSPRTAAEAKFAPGTVGGRQATTKSLNKNNQRHPQRRDNSLSVSHSRNQQQGNRPKTRAQNRNHPDTSLIVTYASKPSPKPRS